MRKIREFYLYWLGRQDTAFPGIYLHCHWGSGYRTWRILPFPRRASDR